MSRKETTMSIFDTVRHKTQRAVGGIQERAGKALGSTRHADRGRARRARGKAKQAGSTLRNRAKRVTRAARGRRTA